MIFQAAAGRGGELAALFVESAAVMQEAVGTPRPWRVLTDLSGPFDTVVLEIEAESLGTHEETRPRLFASQAFRESMARSQGMIVSGRNEFYTLEAHG